MCVSGYSTAMKSGIIRIVLAAATLGTLSTTALPQPAVADATSTALIAGASVGIGRDLVRCTDRGFRTTAAAATSATNRA